MCVKRKDFLGNCLFQSAAAFCVLSTTTCLFSPFFTVHSVFVFRFVTFFFCLNIICRAFVSCSRGPFLSCLVLSIFLGSWGKGGFDNTSKTVFFVLPRRRFLAFAMEKMGWKYS